jgi:hypothetical protein
MSPMDFTISTDWIYAKRRNSREGGGMPKKIQNVVLIKTGLTLLSPVVTIRTTCFNTPKVCILPTECS